MLRMRTGFRGRTSDSEIRRGRETFAPFDRDGYVRYSKDKTLAQLLDEFARVRAKALGELLEMKLTAEDLKRRGRHPSFGVVTLSELLATWAAHDLTHLHQISRIMAYQYREAVGPWVRFLGVMQCAGTVRLRGGGPEGGLMIGLRMQACKARIEHSRGSLKLREKSGTGLFRIHKRKQGWV